MVVAGCTAGGRMWLDEDEGEEGADVGDEGRVCGEKVMDGWGGGSSVVEDEIRTMSVSIYRDIIRRALKRVVMVNDVPS